MRLNTVCSPQGLILEGKNRADFENLPRNAMKAKKKLRRRPKKNPGELEFWRFVRAGLIMCTFDEAREGGDKHSAAITHVVEYVRKHHPGMPVSETEVKRTLATYRPKNIQTILQFKRSIADDGKLATLRCVREQVAKMRSERNSIGAATLDHRTCPEPYNHQVRLFPTATLSPP